jgi:hypothetical protein|nr:hypothetical protein [uncultured Capnocytophaga sp.]
MIQKLLLCLNESYRNSQEKIQKFFERKFLGKSKINRIYDFVYDLDSFKEKLPLVRNNGYDALIVLCELIWDEQGKSHSYTDFWGINLVQKEIALDREIDTPVLFISFCSRAEILSRYPYKQIISLYALGYHFIQLPVSSSDERRAFNSMQRISPLEKEDGYQYAHMQGMLSIIRHDVKDGKHSDYYRDWLTQIIQTAPDSKQKEELLSQVKESSSQTIGILCTKAEELFTIDYPISLTEEPHKVLILDDDPSRLENLIKEGQDKGLSLTLCTKTSEALKRIEQDVTNAYKVAIVDFRIWDNPNVPPSELTMTEPQGYRFIEEVAKLGHYCIFISFSNLPRMFRLKLSSLSHILIVPEDKELVLSNEQQQANFIQKIQYWIAQATERIRINVFKNDNWFKIYKKVINIKENNREIDEESEKIIHSFIEISEKVTESIDSKNLKVDKEIEKFKKQLEKLKYREEKNVNTSNFVPKLIIRRLAIYLYYWFEEEASITDKITSYVNCFLVNPFLLKEIESHTNNRITSQALSLSSNTKDLKRFQDILLTYEERVFFRQNYPYVYKKYIEKPDNQNFTI